MSSCVIDSAITYEEALKKNPELKESDVQMLREWCAKQPHLPKISDMQLAVFLHCNYYRMEPTKTRIDLYYTMRTHLPEFFSNRDPLGSKEIRASFKHFTFFRLDKLTVDGYRIDYARMNDPPLCIFNDCIKYVNMVVDLCLHMEGGSLGAVFIFNVQGLKPAHLSRVSPMALKKYLFYLQEALLQRLKRVHFIKTVPAIDILMEMLKPFMKKELAEKIHFHSTTESLAKFMPLDALPNDDGGKAGNVADLAAESVKWLEDNREWFQTEDATMTVNESLRPGKAKNSTDLFGVEGSFKKIDVD